MTPHLPYQPQHLDPLAQGKRGQLPPLSETIVAPLQDGAEAVEVDEVWSFGRRKGQTAWVWLAVSYQSRQVLAMVVGDRSARTCRKLWERIPEAYRALTTYTDFCVQASFNWQAYQQVIPQERHVRCGKETGLTNTVERFNNTPRRWVGRMVRKTLSFSKSCAMHLLCLRLFIDGYNRYCVRRFRLEPPQPPQRSPATI